MKYILAIMLGTCIGVIANYYLMPITVTSNCIKSSTPKETMTQAELDRHDPCEEYEVIQFKGSNF